MFLLKPARCCFVMAHFIEKSCSDLLNKKDQYDLYEILGCDEVNTKEQINAEFKKKALQFHPDKNRKEDGEADKTHQMFERLKKARDILCDDSKRRQYDYWRRIGLQDYITFDEWMQKSYHMQASVHWAPKTPKKNMLTDKKCSDDSCEENPEECYESRHSKTFTRYQPYCRTGFGVRRNHLIRKFQNYEI